MGIEVGIGIEVGVGIEVGIGIEVRIGIEVGVDRCGIIRVGDVWVGMMDRGGE